MVIYLIKLWSAKLFWAMPHESGSLVERKPSGRVSLYNDSGKGANTTTDTSCLNILNKQHYEDLEPHSLRWYH